MVLRICMLLERAKTKQDGRVRREVRTLASAGHEVILLHHGAGEQDQEALRADGAQTRSVRPGGAAGRLLASAPRPLERIVLWARYASVAARARPDVVHAHDLTMLGPGWVAALLARARLVYDTHEYAAGVPYRSRAGRVVTRVLERALMRRCADILVVSPEAAAQLQADHRLARPPAVVRNVPLADWPGAPDSAAPVIDLRAALGLDGAPLVLHQGAATPGRGCVELVNAVARLDGAHLLFLGDIEPGFAGSLRAEAVAVEAEERVHLRSSVPLEVLLAHTAQADAGVCLSDPRWVNHRVTLSNKLFEYIAAGVPVVATQGTAFGALVERLGVGVVARFGDADALAEAITGALAMGASEGARQRLAEAAAELRWEREGERLLAVYSRLRRRSTRQHARSST